MMNIKTFRIETDLVPSPVEYAAMFPREYETSNKEYPLMLFLHGAGERGADLDSVKVHGPPKMIAEGRDFPFIVVSPQCPTGEWWSEDVLNALLDEVIETYRVDETRIYVTGLSMGSYGTWRLAQTYPDRIAAIVPICGGGDPSKVERIRDIVATHAQSVMAQRSAMAHPRPLMGRGREIRL